MFSPVVGALLMVLLSLVPARAQEYVDVALVLAVDVSRSMSPEELRIQREGYAAAIASPEVIRAIGDGAHRRIAITFFEWAGNHHAREIIDWTLIQSPDDAKAVAARLLAGSSESARRTSISGAIETGMHLIDEVPFLAERYVIDISGDGPNNQGLTVTDARDLAVANGIVINGLPLMTRGGIGSHYNIDDLDEYYRRCVIGGPGSFVVPVNDWAQFPEAVRRKLVLEIGNYMSGPKVWRAQIRFSEPYDCLIGEKIRQQRMWQFDFDN
ncbi:DUF1194 domain-containing protein [Roseibium sp.]|uniref:DUF1194 domain-containing protein n=1 Tax=Roseibium sp. TaxID=1936156 RepID=UPI003A96EC85